MSEQTEDKKQILINAFTKTGIVVIFILLVLIVLKVFLHQGERGLAEKIVCGSHLSSLGKTLIIYAKDHNDNYPEPDKWCDTLMEEKDFNKKELLCSADKIGPCSYATNSNCKPDSDPNVVLLFETRPGWNQNGGREILTDNHKGGSNILFNDGRVLFIEAKDFNNLKWK